LVIIDWLNIGFSSSANQVIQDGDKKKIVQKMKNSMICWYQRQKTCVN